MFSLRHRGHSRINNVLTVWLWGVRQSDRLRVLKGDTPKFPFFLFFVPRTGRMPAVKLVHAPCRGCALQSVLSLAHLWTRWLLSALWSKWWKQSCDVTVPLWKSYVLKFCLAVFFVLTLNFLCAKWNIKGRLMCAFRPDHRPAKHHNGARLQTKVWYCN